MPLPDPVGGDAQRSSAAVAFAAALTALPSLLAYNLPPSSTLLNQVLAVGAWGALVLALAPGRVSARTWPLQVALAVMVGGVLWSWGPGQLPASLALVSLGTLLAAAALVWAGGAAAQRDDAAGVFGDLAWAMLATGLVSAAVALVQVFAPHWTDGNVIAHSGLAGRAVGNLRQPNHLCSLLLWGSIAAVALHELGRLPLRWTVAAVLLLVFAVELSASRTGAAGMLLLVAWGAFGRRLSGRMRLLLLAVPLVYALSYGAMLAWGEWTQQVFGAEARRAAGEAAAADSPNSRLRVWATALAMIAAEPWSGVGFGEFNLAWTLTGFERRPTAFFDHTHNLPLQLAAELGVPLALAVTGLLAYALVAGLRRGGAVQGERSLAAQAGTMMAATIGLHSLVEYPLWYAYFLLPTAFVWGFALATGPGPSRAPRRSVAGMLAGALLVAGSALALVDYLRVSSIYSTDAGAAPLDERIARGQRSVLFAYHADYAAATTPGAGFDSALAFERAPHNLLDIRLMIAWARHLDASGRPELARTLAQRIREFGSSDADEFLAACDAPGAADFQCRPPEGRHGWREFLVR